MFVTAQDMGIRNWVKIQLVSTTVPPFTTAKTKFGTKDTILFLKYTPKLYAYP
jgi:hypothetical protein